MTTVEFYMSEQGIRGFEIRDHNGCSYGQDIVCAAISALSQTAVMGLQDVGVDCSVEIRDAFYVT